jgi:L-threonylcarbamoyladenylate synthase
MVHLLLTRKLHIDPINPDMGAIAEASGIVKAGGIIIFPTETVYGIGANALNESACRRIFALKGRPSDNPLIVHVSSLEMAEGIASIPAEYRDGIRRVWPSPITFIAKSNGTLQKAVTGGLSTVAVRMPAHPVALALISECGVPIAAPSANPSGRPSATNPRRAISYFDGRVECIIDSGAAFFGIESTVIDLESFTVLRPGPFTPEEIEKAFGRMPKVDAVTRGMAHSGVAVSPGVKYAHYAPKTKLLLFSGDIGELTGLLDGIQNLPPFAFIGSAESCKAVSEAFGCSTIALGDRPDLYKIAKNLYDGIIALDSLNVAFGIIEAFEERGIGLAIMNRIRKACSGTSFNSADGLSKILEP